MPNWFESGTLTRVLNNFRAIAQDPRNILDILVVALAVYGVIALARKTRAAQVAKGAGVLLAIYVVAYALELRTVTYLMNAVLQIGFLALIVLFQPELRRALEQMGQTDKWAAGLFHSRRVDPSLRGQGVAGQLVKRAAGALRSTGRKARVTCSYARDWFARHPEEADVLVDGWENDHAACRLGR